MGREQLGQWAYSNMCNGDIDLNTDAGTIFAKIQGTFQEDSNYRNNSPGTANEVGRTIFAHIWGTFGHIPRRFQLPEPFLQNSHYSWGTIFAHIW